jgi:hypothetical protein
MLILVAQGKPKEVAPQSSGHHNKLWYSKLNFLLARCWWHLTIGHSFSGRVFGVYTVFFLRDEAIAEGCNRAYLGK